MRLKDYIGGSRRGREANRIEREALDDPLFREALEGFEMVEGSHGEIIDRLRTRVRSDSGIAARNRRRIRMAVAASLLVIATGSTMLLTRYIPETDVPHDVLSMQSVREEVGSILNGPPAELRGADMEQVAGIAEQRVVAQSTQEWDETVAAKESAGFNHVTVTDDAVLQPDPVISEELQPAARPDRKVEKAHVSQPSPAGTSKISGRVVDDNGEALPGVTVFNQSRNDYAATDANGSYTIAADTGDQLLFSHLGYEKESLAVESQGDMTAVLKPESQALADVMITGYGSNKKGALTGSTAGISTDTMEAGSSLNDTDLQTAISEGYSRASLSRISVANAGVNGDEMAAALGAFYEKMDRVRHVSPDGKEGYAVVAFEVNSRGKPRRAEVISPLSPEADKEALRIIDESGRWPRTEGMVTVRIDFAGN